MAMNNEEMQRLLNEVARRSAVDPEFRSLAIRDSGAAIAKVSSKQLPADISFKFADNSGKNKVFPLPDPVTEISQELSEVELENVAGGDISAGGGWGKKPAQSPTLGS